MVFSACHSILLFLRPIFLQALGRNIQVYLSLSGAFSDLLCCRRPLLDTAVVDVREPIANHPYTTKMHSIVLHALLCATAIQAHIIPPNANRVERRYEEKRQILGTLTSLMGILSCQILT
jgi:hypothetical protein